MIQITGPTLTLPTDNAAPSPEPSEHVKRLESELAETRIALVEVRREKYALEDRLRMIRAAATIA